MAKRPDRSVPGLLIVDKSSGMTSHDVVSRVRRLAHTRKVGHAGTLDPMATGVLVVGIGKATRLLTYISGSSKTYNATIRLGIETTTEDAEGQLISARGCPSLDESALERVLSGLRGDILQVPSKVSALKIAGQRAHALVRAGKEVELEARPVHISRLEVCAPFRSSVCDLAEDVFFPVDAEEKAYFVASDFLQAQATFDIPRNTKLKTPHVPVVDVDVVVECSSGTYVRALARDIGAALGCGAHLTYLRRTQVGVFTLDHAHTLESCEALSVDDLSQNFTENTEKTEASTLYRVGEETIGSAPVCAPAPFLLPLDEVVHSLFPTLVLTEEEALRFAHGNPPQRHVPALAGQHSDNSGHVKDKVHPIAALHPDGHVMGLLAVRSGKLVTLLVF
ncbi:MULTISPECIES: tRNA pseudouridine(55) synthase TruB [unclassified Schaalia]|uniref:tRNA pseudouridine(55) synthase TruB n=1 Tax=unclassified Schaalia TaxID=2691889 RepID=UPI001E5B7233|nr:MULTISPECIES: tRNA pseudouridine(55) synthase TruB [unclassified Schaalia]MCD4549383.1 tRNA pseudouridine(55) synthase TruB [Schaalia sp. lx-260]MCD4557943.1 tRNA pseudouridine(55) synthase TruB [Schaalia sp. lx-100]